MDDETRKYLNNLKLGEIPDLTDDAKLLIYLNPRIINKLAETLSKNLDAVILYGLHGKFPDLEV